MHPLILSTSSVLVAFLTLTLNPSTSHAAGERPNIIVFYTDDHGHADLSCQGVFDDVQTPHVDAIARQGVRALHGYSTAPQCVPSRAGLLSGRFQSRFGVETNGSDIQGFNEQTTIAERLQTAGYITAQFGKWHLGPSDRIIDHGFKHVFAQNSQAAFSANISLAGDDRPMSRLEPQGYHVDSCSQAAAAIINRYHDQPLFLYVAYRAPHVPLDAPEKYLRRFPGKMPERRRKALAMISAVDDGVGLVMQTLADHQLTEKTLVFYIGDNGAPLKIHKTDAPGGGPGWDGSLNDPLNGEKGMLTEGGMHTPFVVSWPGKIPGGQEYPHPITALDVAATAVAISGVEVPEDELDGVNLIPFLSGQNEAPPHDALLWRWDAQSAIRAGKWKLLRGGNREYLFDLDADLQEQANLIKKHPEIANRLRSQLNDWANELTPPGFKSGALGGAWSGYFDFYLDDKTPASSKRAAVSSNKSAGDFAQGWQNRNSTITASDEGWLVNSIEATRPQPAFLTRNNLTLQGPVTVKVILKAPQAGEIGISWRTSKTADFTRENQYSIALKNTEDWQTVETTLAVDDMCHVRVLMPKGTTLVKSIELIPATGTPVTLD
jgi:uncharacterized sulfatase